MMAKEHSRVHPNAVRREREPPGHGTVFMRCDIALLGRVMLDWQSAPLQVCSGAAGLSSSAANFRAGRAQEAGRPHREKFEMCFKSIAADVPLEVRGAHSLGAKRQVYEYSATPSVI